MISPRIQPPRSLEVLLAEDEPLIRELVATYLQRAGCNVVEAKDGAAALTFIRNQSPKQFDLILTDLLMPKAGGEAVVRYAQEQGVCSRFLIMSGNPVNGYESAAKASGRFEFIQKPFTFGDFEAKLSSLVQAGQD